MFVGAKLSEEATLSGAAEGPEDRGAALFWTQLFAMIVPFVFICLRAYVRFFITKSVHWDDGLMFFAFVVYAVYGVISINGVVNAATGKRLDMITTDEAIVSLKAWYLCEVLYSPITVAIRTSICLHLLRIAHQQVYRWIIFANLFVIWGISIAYFFIMTFQCMPPSYFWEQLLGHKGKCVGVNVVPDATIAHSIISALSDWCIGLLPIPLLWNVKLNIRTKITVGILLSMGMIAGVALILRIPYLKRLAISAEFLYETIDVACWSVSEPALGITAGCAATLRPLFKSWGLGWVTTAGASSNNNKVPTTTSTTTRDHKGSPNTTGNAGPTSASRLSRNKTSSFSGPSRLSSFHHADGPRGSHTRGSASSVGSDIELSEAGARPAGVVVAGPGGVARSSSSTADGIWDLERGDDMQRLEPGGAPIVVRTEIDVSAVRTDAGQPLARRTQQFGTTQVVSPPRRPGVAAKRF